MSDRQTLRSDTNVKHRPEKSGLKWRPFRGLALTTFSALAPGGARAGRSDQALAVERLCGGIRGDDHIQGLFSDAPTRDHPATAQAEEAGIDLRVAWA